MPFTFHGIGTANYGERDYWPDGSYVTTEWIVFAFVPISPILSKRLTSTNQGKPHAVRDESGYYIYETTSPNRKQVVSVYGWFASLIGIAVGFSQFQDTLTRIVGDEDRAAASWFLVLGIVLALPYLLRRLAKRRKMKQWKREAMGLGPIAS
jgi:hypothetical protein